MSIFSSFSKGNSDFTSFELSYHYHDPASEKIVVYNNGKKTIGLAKLVVMNETKQQFEHTVEKIASRMGILIQLAQFRDKKDQPFTGNLAQVQVQFSEKKVVFFPEGNKFKREE